MLRRVRREFEQGKSLLQFGALKGVGDTCGMVASLLVAKYFSSELFGSYSLTRMLVFFFSAMLISSSQTPFIVLAGQEKNDSGRINKTFTVQVLLFAASLGVFAVVVTALGRYAAAFAGISRYDLWFALLAFVGLAMKTFLCNLFLAMNERARSSLADLVFGTATLAWVVAFGLMDRVTLRTVFLAHFLAAALVAALFARRIDMSQLRPITLDRRHLVRMLHFTKWLVLGTAAAYFINWGDNIVLRAVVSMEDIGDYNLGYQIFKGVSMLVLIIPAYLLPFVSRHIKDSDRMRSYLYNKRPKIFLLGLALIIVAFAAAAPAFRWAYGEAYHGSMPVLRILFVAPVIILYAVFYEGILYALERYRFAQAANVAQVVLNLALDVLLVPAMGIRGAALATVCAYLCRTVMVEVYFQVRLKPLMNL